MFYLQEVEGVPHVFVFAQIKGQDLRRRARVKQPVERAVPSVKAHLWKAVGMQEQEIQTKDEEERGGGADGRVKVRNTEMRHPLKQNM